MVEPRRRREAENAPLKGVRILIVESGYYQDVADTLLAGARRALDAAGMSLRDLDGLAESEGTLTVGALVRQRELERWAATRLPLFAHALSLVAHAPIRNRGTVVGNLVHADPASELPALLLCLDGALMARRKGGERVVPADKLYLAPLTTSLESDEVATAARFCEDALHRYLAR